MRLTAEISKISLITSLFMFTTNSFAQDNSGDMKGDALKGEQKSFTCMGCHGEAGLRNAYPNYSVPKLAGQNEAYIASALKAYRDGEREHATMQGNAATLSDEDIADIAAYFSAQ